MKIAFIGGRGVVGTYSGIETYYEEVGSRLAGRGHSVTAYCRKHFTPEVKEFRGMTVRRLPALRSKHLETLSHSLLATTDSLRRDFDVIQFHAIGSSFCSFLPRLFGIASVVSVRGLDWKREKWNWFARNFLLAGEWASARFPTATTVVSRSLQRHYLSKHGRSTTHIPNAVIPGEFRPPDLIKGFGLGHHNFLLFAGRISPEKGVHTLLEAYATLAGRIKLVLAGGTSYSDEYIEEIKRIATENVVFLGQVDRRVMNELYSNCYAFVLPSTMEGLSVALLEALSFGTCIITTNIPENQEVVGATALCVDPDDVQHLRHALTEVLEDSTVAQRMRHSAAKRARSLPDWDEVARLTESLYLSLVAQIDRENG